VNIHLNITCEEPCSDVAEKQTEGALIRPSGVYLYSPLISVWHWSGSITSRPSPIRSPISSC